MRDTFLYAAEAIVPMLLLMLLGFYVARSGLFDSSLLKKMNTFTFRFGISAMMFRSIYTLPSLQSIQMPVLIFVVVSSMVLTAMGWVEARFLTNCRARRGVMIQNSFRSNFAVIAITLATALGGEAGAAVAASMQAPAIIYFNITAVLCLSAYSDRQGQTINPWLVIRQIIINPMILGQVGGLVCLIVRGLLPVDASGQPIFTLSGSLPYLYSAIDSLASMASPLILILLGAQVDFHKVGDMKKEVFWGVLQRLIIAPLAGFGMAFFAQWIGLLTLTPAVASALIGLFGSPVAVASAVMTEEMGGDAELARQYVVWTAELSMFTLFLWILLLRAVGIL